MDKHRQKENKWILVFYFPKYMQCRQTKWSSNNTPSLKCKNIPLFPEYTAFQTSPSICHCNLCALHTHFVKCHRLARTWTHKTNEKWKQRAFNFIHAPLNLQSASVSVLYCPLRSPMNTYRISVRTLPAKSLDIISYHFIFSSTYLYRTI